MADGFIVRRGGKATEQALAPTITETETTISSFKFTLKNEDTEKAIIRYRIDDINDEGEIIELAGGATSDDIEITGLASGTEFIVFATANVTGKVKSNVTQLAIETDPIIYTAATGGTTEEYNLDGKRYKSHTFTSNGTFEVTTAGDADGDRNKVDYLIIAGGGGAGGGTSGGGGAGGYRTTNGTSGGPSPTTESKVTVTATSYGVTVGLGGAGGATDGSNGSNGANSSVSFPTTITSTGGGGGKHSGAGITGGSGGGAGYVFSGATVSGGAGTSGQGFAGGDVTVNTSGGTGFAGAGGGGAGSVGGNVTTNTIGGTGGNGLANLLRTGSNETRAVGGKGSSTGDGSGTAGTTNTGNGASGPFGVTSGQAGGSGIVIIRYEIAPTT
jgi:hypothetical protein